MCLFVCVCVCMCVWMMWLDDVGEWVVCVSVSFFLFLGGGGGSYICECLLGGVCRFYGVFFIVLDV